MPDRAGLTLKITAIMGAAVILVLFAVGITPAAAAGTITVESPHSVKMTLDRMAAAMEAKGVTIIARIDHAAGAASVGTEMPPTELMIFGNPKIGTPLIVKNREVAFELPLKALAWRDADGKVWLSVTDPAALDAEYALDGADGAIGRMSGALKAFTAKAVEP